jgi:hypothetical protein
MIAVLCVYSRFHGFAADGQTGKAHMSLHQVMLATGAYEAYAAAKSAQVSMLSMAIHISILRITAGFNTNDIRL